MRLEWLVHDMTSSEHNSRAKKRKKKTTGKMEREREQMTTKRRLGGKGNQELAGAGVRQIVTRRGCEMV